MSQRLILFVEAAFRRKLKQNKIVTAVTWVSHEYLVDDAAKGHPDAAETGETKLILAAAHTGTHSPWGCRGKYLDDATPRAS